MKVKVASVLAIGALCLAFAVGILTIDLEGLPAGTIVKELTSGKGISGSFDGVVKVFGYNPSFGPSINAAVIFDSAKPTGLDWDLGTPNEKFNGPGKGLAGETTNKVALGHILIVAENLVDKNNDGLVDDPDDADVFGAFIEFDFSMVKKGRTDGTVMVDSLTVMDVEIEEGEKGAKIELWGPKLPKNTISIPPTGDNGVATISNIGLKGVSNMRVLLNGSGAITGIVFTPDEVVEPGKCWFTFGGFQNAGEQSGGKEYTFGGNVGPPPSGSIQVNDHTTGDKFHSNDVHIVRCEYVPTKTGPGQPGGKKGFKPNKAVFAGTGKLNHVDGYPFTGYVIDAGEPAGKKDNDKDYFEIVVRDPVSNKIVFKTSAELDGGNVQLHPPVGKGAK